MGLLDKIEQLQKKPQQERKKILVVVMTISMSLIIGIWITSFQYSVSKDKTTEEAPKPFSLVWSSIKDSSYNITGKVKKNFEGIKTYAEDYEDLSISTTTETDIDSEKGTTTQETI